jgi:DNA-binding HxlR family transcriptional regulator
MFGVLPMCSLIEANIKIRAGMEKTDDYYLRAVIAILSSKWTLPVLYGLRDGTRRYHEINKAVPDMTQKVLTDMLHKLERHGFVERVAHPTVPPKVEYTLTDLGGSFVGALVPVVDWTKDHLHEVHEAQEVYDSNGLISMD